MDGTPIVITIIIEHQPNGFSLKETIHKKPTSHHIPQKIHSSITHFHHYFLRLSYNSPTTQYSIYFMYIQFQFEPLFTINTPDFYPNFNRNRNK